MRYNAHMDRNAAASLPSTQQLQCCWQGDGAATTNAKLPVTRYVSPIAMPSYGAHCPQIRYPHLHARVISWARQEAAHASIFAITVRGKALAHSWISWRLATLSFPFLPFPATVQLKR